MSAASAARGPGRTGRPEEMDTKRNRTERYPPSLLQLQDFVLQRLVELLQERRDVNRLLHDGVFDRVEPELPLLPCSKESNGRLSQAATSARSRRQRPSRRRELSGAGHAAWPRCVVQLLSSPTGSTQVPVSQKGGGIQTQRLTRTVVPVQSSSPQQTPQS